MTLYILGSISEHILTLISVIMTALKMEQWTEYVNSVMRILKPGGWVQFTELRGVHLYSVGNVPGESPLREVLPLSHKLTELQFERYLEEEVKSKGTYGNGDHLEGHVRDAGFDNVEITKLFIDIGDWREGNFSRLSA